MLSSPCPRPKSVVTDHHGIKHQQRVFLCSRVSRRTEMGTPVEGYSLFPPSDGWRHLSGEYSGHHRSSRVN